MAGKLGGIAWGASCAVAGAGAVACILDAALIEPNALCVKRVHLPARRDVDGLSGLRLAHLSDLHIEGRGWKRATTVAAIDAINRQDIDLIALTGDFIGAGRGARAAVELLSTLRTDVPRVAVFGNHDHVYGRTYLEFLWSGLEDAGVIVLNNEAVSLSMPSGSVSIGGVDDAYSDRDNLDAVRREMARVSGPRILLTHYPDLAERLRDGEIQLSLAGHSHGGQIRLPVVASWVHRLHARTAYGKGLFRVNGNPMYVSPGIGMSGIPMRFRNPPEIAVIEFATAAARGPAAEEQVVAERELVTAGEASRG